MQKSLKISFIAHSAILIISSITLPFLMGRVQAPLVMSVDLVQIGERTNIPYAPKVSDGAKTDKKIKGTSKKLHGLVEKFKAPDRFCIDILLCCIFLGLIAILYYLIKSKFFTTKTTNKSTSESYSISRDFCIMGMMIILYI